MGRHQGVHHGRNKRHCVLALRRCLAAAASGVGARCVARDEPPTAGACSHQRHACVPSADMGGRPDGVACGDGSATDSDGGASVRGQPSTAHTTECWEEYAVGWTPAAPVPKHVQDSRLRSRCEQRGYVIVPETPTVDLADVVLHLLGHSVDKTTFVRGCAERLDAQASRLLVSDAG